MIYGDVRKKIMSFENFFTRFQSDISGCFCNIFQKKFNFSLALFKKDPFYVMQCIEKQGK